MRADAVGTRRKVLHIHFGTDGGAERFFVNLVQALGRRGVEQRFVIRPGRRWRGEIDALGPIVEGHHRRLSLASLRLQRRLRATLREWQPDVIMAWKQRAARLLPEWPQALRVVRFGDFPPHLKHLRRCDALVCNMPGIGRRCRELGWTGPLHTITNFVREPEEKVRPVARAELDTPEDAFVISGAGRFVPTKGFDLLVRAAARVPDAWLWLIGDGEERPALEALARETGIAGRTRFTGWVEEPARYVAATDVFGMPSRHEPFGNVVLEAWRTRVPVVATRSEGPGWYMRNGENGMVVDIDDAGAFASAVERIRSDRALGPALAAGGRARLAEMFDEERIVDRYLDLFAGRLAGASSTMPEPMDSPAPWPR